MISYLIFSHSAIQPFSLSPSQSVSQAMRQLAAIELLNPKDFYLLLQN